MFSGETLNQVQGDRKRDENVITYVITHVITSFHPYML